MYPLVQVNTFNFQGKLGDIYYAYLMWGYWLREVKFTQGQKLLNDKSRFKPRTSLFLMASAQFMLTAGTPKGFPGGSDNIKCTCGVGDLFRSLGREEKFSKRRNLCYTMLIFNFYVCCTTNEWCNLHCPFCNNKEDTILFLLHKEKGNYKAENRRSEFQETNTEPTTMGKNESKIRKPLFLMLYAYIVTIFVLYLGLWFTTLATQ